MTIEALLERIAVALEKSNELRAQPMLTFEGTDLTARKENMLRQAEEIMASEKKKGEEKDEPETKPEKKPEKEKPKYDFNKEIRQPFVELLNTTKNRHGPKDATLLAKKLLKDFTGQTEEPLTVKTLPEEKYEAFLAAVKEQRSYVLNDEVYAGFDKD